MKLAYNIFVIFLATNLVWQGLLTPAKSTPLDLGFGGVYNSPEANAYWARRFGTNFFASLASGNVNTYKRVKTDRRTISQLKSNADVQ